MFLLPGGLPNVIAAPADLGSIFVMAGLRSEAFGVVEASTQQ